MLGFENEGKQPPGKPRNPRVHSVDKTSYTIKGIKVLVVFCAPN